MWPAEQKPDVFVSFLKFITTYLLSTGRIQWAVKVSALPGEYFWSYSDKQQEEQNN